MERIEQGAQLNLTLELDREKSTLSKAFYKLTAKHANFLVRLSGSEHLSTTSWITLFAACYQTTAKLISLPYNFSLQSN